MENRSRAKLYPQQRHLDYTIFKHRQARSAETEVTLSLFPAPLHLRKSQSVHLPAWPTGHKQGQLSDPQVVTLKRGRCSEWNCNYTLHTDAYTWSLSFMQLCIRHERTSVLWWWLIVVTYSLLLLYWTVRIVTIIVELYDNTTVAAA